MKTSLFKKIFLAVILIITYSSCRKKHWKCDEDVSYKNDIQPLMASHCNKCHGYDTYSEVQTLANSGRLKDVTITTSKMPPSDGTRLTSKERKKIYCWLEGGALDN